MNWREAFICLFLFFAALLLWQKLDSDEEVITQTIENNAATPGFYLIGSELVRYNDAGDPLYTITAERIEENLDDKSLELSQLDIIYGSDKNSQWKISANQATLPENRKSINFRGNVIAKKLANNNKASFRSESLNYDIANEILTTQAPVTARQGIQKITANGMTLNIKDEQVKLHSNVKIRLQLP